MRMTTRYEVHLRYPQDKWFRPLQDFCVDTRFPSAREAMRMGALYCGSGNFTHVDVWDTKTGQHMLAWQRLV
jgi:hypothetical protein